MYAKGVKGVKCASVQVLCRVMSMMMKVLKWCL